MERRTASLQQPELFV